VLTGRSSFISFSASTSKLDIHFFPVCKKSLEAKKKVSNDDKS